MDKQLIIPLWYRSNDNLRGIIYITVLYTEQSVRR